MQSMAPLTVARTFSYGRIRCHLRHRKPMRVHFLRPFDVIYDTVNRYAHFVCGRTLASTVPQTLRALVLRAYGVIHGTVNHYAHVF